jgi:uncharacterized protein (TIGR02996 family)
VNVFPSLGNTPFSATFWEAREAEGETVTHDDAFLQAIQEAPEDDSPRLIYADWLDEHGNQDRAEFIRTQCERLRLRHTAERALALREQVRALLDRHTREWLPSSLLQPEPVRVEQAPVGVLQISRPGPPLPGRSPRKARFVRGFLDEVHLILADWLKLGPALVRQAPLQGVFPTDVSMRRLRMPATPTEEDAPVEEERPRYVWPVFDAAGQPLPNRFGLLAEFFPGGGPGQMGYSSVTEADEALSAACLAWARAQPG